MRRYVVANVEVKVVAERVQYFDANGKLITESLKDYTRNTLAKEFASLDDFLRHWSKAEKKHAIIDELAHQGIFFEALADEVDKQSGKDFDPFDLLCHVAWDQPLSRARSGLRRSRSAITSPSTASKRRRYSKPCSTSMPTRRGRHRGNADPRHRPLQPPGHTDRTGACLWRQDQYQQAVGELERELYRA